MYGYGLPSCACPDALCVVVGVGLSLFGAYWKGEGDKVVFSGQCFDQHHAPDYCALYLQARENTHTCTENVPGTGYASRGRYMYRHIQMTRPGPLCVWRCLCIMCWATPIPRPCPCLRACVDVLCCDVLQSNTSLCTVEGTIRQVAGGVVECFLDDPLYDCPLATQVHHTQTHTDTTHT